MVARSLRKLCADMPDWLSPEQVNDLIAEIFTAADDGEDAVTVGNAIMEVMVRAGENPEWLTIEDQRRILAWIEANWSVEPRPFFSRLCALTVNLKLDEAKALLQEKLENETDPDRKQELQSTLDDLLPDAEDDVE